MGFSKKFTAGALSAAIILSSIGLGACGKNYASPKNDDEALVVTVGDNKIYMDEAKCYIYFSEVEGQNTSAIYTMYGISTDYWNEASFADENKTNAQATKDDIVDTIIENTVLYNDAVATGKYEVTDEQKKVFTDNAQKLIDCMSDDQIKKTGFTVDDFVDYQVKTFIAGKYKEDVIAGFNITRDDFLEDYDYENEYRGYETTYVRVPITTTDSDGNTMDISDVEKELLHDTMETIREQIVAGTEFSDIVTEYTDTGVTSYAEAYTIGEYNKIELDNSSEDSEATESDDSDDEDDVTVDNPEYIMATIGLGNGEISEIFEADGYYYIARMDNNDSTYKYDSELETAVSEKEQSEYDKWYEGLTSGDYAYTVNNEVWDTIDIGEVTIIADEFLKAWGLLENPADN